MNAMETEESQTDKAMGQEMHTDDIKAHVDTTPTDITIVVESPSTPDDQTTDTCREETDTSSKTLISDKARASTVMSRFQRRNNPSSAGICDEDVEVGKGWRNLRHAVKVTNAVSMKKKSAVTREDSFLKKFSTRQPNRVESNINPMDNCNENRSKHEKNKHRTVFRLDGNLMLYWLGIVTVAVLYNLWTCIAREAFREIHQDHLLIWITFDVLFDVVYVLDIVFQFRTGYLDQGLMVYDSTKLAKKYVSSKYFYLDLACLFPLDFLQFLIGIHPMVRFPRFIKLYRTFRFLYMLESRTAYPNFFRVANLTHILFLGSHWFAAFYYLISEAEDFKGGWSYPKPVGEFSSVTRKYLASLFWSTLTLTTIGDLPPPETNWEYVFVIVSYLIGVFIFATIVGQVGNVITNRNASRQEFERLLDGAKLYMRMHNVPPQLQKRVQRWYDYVWKRGRMKGSDINSLGMLPDKFKTELAIHVNLETLKKVTIFQECQPEFLHDLVLKMRAYIFTPGDLICRRGEVAREMFIIADGLVEIISETGTVLTQMGTGDFFGEIGILNLDAGVNRRTADVKSVGYSELFGLSREDVLEALKDHPDAEAILVEYGRKRLQFSSKDKTSNGDVMVDHHDKKNKTIQIIRCYGQRRLKEIEKHRRLTKKSNLNSSLNPGHLWSPNSPCRGLRAIISASQKSSPNNQSSLPGIHITNFDEDNKNSGRSKLVNKVKRLVGRRGTRKRDKTLQRSHQTSLIHPIDTSQSSRLYACDINASCSAKGNGELIGESKQDQKSASDKAKEHGEYVSEDGDRKEAMSSGTNPNEFLFPPSVPHTPTGTFNRTSSMDNNSDENHDCNVCSRTSSVSSNTNTITSENVALSKPSDTNSPGITFQGDSFSPSIPMATNQHQLPAGSPTNSNSGNHQSSSNSSRLYQPPYRNYIRVLQGVSKWPESFTLPDEISDIEEEHSPNGSPRVRSRCSSTGSVLPDNESCCCKKLKRHLHDVEHKLGTMEEVYRNSLQMLSEIAEQQTVIIKSMKSTKKPDISEVSTHLSEQPEIEMTRL